MKKGLIVGLIASGVALVGTITAIVIIKKKKEGEAGTGDAASETPSGGIVEGATNIVTGIFNSATQGNANAGKSFKASAVSEEPSKGRIVVNLAYSRPPKGTIVAGNKVVLSNFDQYNGEYRVTMVWVDGSNAVGAIYLPTNKATVASVDSKKWENKGVITIK